MRGKAGYFPATYVIPLQADQRVFQVLQPLNLLDGNNSIKFHKDQVSTVAFERLLFEYAKTKAQISCAVTAQLISAFVFAT